MPNTTPTTICPVRAAFAKARREALQRQGTITLERVRQNQATMKVLPVTDRTRYSRGR